MRKFVFNHLPWILIMIAITIQSSFPGLPIPKLGISFMDKLLHFFVFGLLGWFMAKGFFLSDNDFIRRHPILMACIIGFFFAFTDELHQSMVPGRTSEFMDWVADSLGILVFASLYFWQRKKKLN